MIFQSPNLLWALSLLAIPIIIHLFQFKRYKRLMFSDVSLLKEIQTKSQTKNQLKHLLVLFARLLFIGFLVLAFAQPFIPAETENQSTNLVTVYIDNSFSMQNATENGSLLQEAKQKAFEIIESYPSSTQFKLVTNDLEGYQRRFSDKDAFISALDEIETSAKRADLGVVSRFIINSDDAEGAVNYFISDFINTRQTEIDTALSGNLRIIPLQGIFNNNISIDSAWIESPTLVAGGEEILHFSITNRGNELANEIPVDILLNNTLQSNLILTLDANQSIDTSIVLNLEEPGLVDGVIQIEDSPIKFDNNYFFSLDIRSSLKVAEIKEKNANSKPFVKLFNEENGAELITQNQSNLLIDSLGSTDFLIFNEPENITSGMYALLSQHLESGKNALVVLPQVINSDLKNGLANELQIEVGSADTSLKAIISISLEDPVYANVFESTPKNLNLPDCRFAWNIASSGGQEKLMTTVNGNAVFSAYPRANGRLFVISSPLSAKRNEFANHALFVPSVFNAALLSGSNSQIAYTTDDVKIASPNTAFDEQIQLVSTDSSSIIPSITYDGLYIGNQTNKDGILNLYNNSNLIGKYAFNFPRFESDLTNSNPEDLIAELADVGIQATIIEADSDSISTQISQADLGQNLWHWALLIALIFLIIESILVKLFHK